MYPRPRSVLLLFFGLLVVYSAGAQSVGWRFVVDGEAYDLSARSSWTTDSTSAAAAFLLSHLVSDGYWGAEVDSVHLAEAKDRDVVSVFARAGEPVQIVSIQLIGFSAIDSSTVRSWLSMRPGDRFKSRELDLDIARIADAYNRRGFVAADLATRVRPVSKSAAVVVDIQVEEKEPITLEAIELAEEIRSSARLVSLFAGLPVGGTLRGYDEERVRSALLDTGLYESVGTPAVRLVSSDRAIISIPMVEASPGAFDLVLGYLPGVSGRSGSVVGNGRLQLVNLFGGGRTVGIRLNRLPGQTSTLSARIADPFLFRVPLGLSLGFDGEQRDSTYAKQQYSAGLSWRILDGLEVGGTVQREATRPGQAGIRIAGATQVVARANALLAGLEVQYRRVDSRISPRRGFEFRSTIQQGVKQTMQLQIVDADTVDVARSSRQERLGTFLRTYVPLTRRQVAVGGIDASLLRSDDYDVSDLLRLGGANSLRGYNEEQFTGRFVGRAVIEYRYLLDPVSFAYGFVDVGYAERPTIGDQQKLSGVHPGYGIGMQYGTGIGVVNASYAVNPDDGLANGRVHVGLSFAL
ncbi:MAG: BamA/TamA family outer membrane protein [Rhodothermales bacterium]